jgi:hypothetical protein
VQKSLSFQTRLPTPPIQPRKSKTPDERKLRIHTPTRACSISTMQLPSIGRGTISQATSVPSAGIRKTTRVLMLMLAEEY